MAPSKQEVSVKGVYGIPPKLESSYSKSVSKL